MPSFTPIDLSKLPFPDFLEPISFETILDEMVQKFSMLYPDFVLGESEPVLKAFEVGAYFRFQDRLKLNEYVKQLYIATATGASLDNLVANLLVERKLGESDGELRARAVSALEGFSTAGPSGAYYYHAISAHPDIADVGVSSPSPGLVQIVVLSKTGVPSGAVLSAVDAALNDENVRPITDLVEIEAVQLVNFAVDATIYTNDGADSSLVLDYAETRLNEYLNAARKVGVDVALSGIYANLHAPGVQKVILHSPTADIVISELQCGNCTGVDVVFGGTNG